MVLLQNYDYTKYFVYRDITNSSLLLSFELFVAFFVVALVEKATRKM